MNWGFIGWVVGVLLTLYVLKFVILALRSLFSKESMQSMLEFTGDKISNANKAMTNKIKEKTEQRREERRRKKIEEDQPMVIIR